MNRLRYWLIATLIALATYAWQETEKRMESSARQELATEAGQDYEKPRYAEGRQPDEQILERMAYTASYNAVTRTPNWVGWVLTGEHADGEFVRNGHSFAEDKDVPAPRACQSDIRESECGYQRGHICPAGDNKWSKQAQEEAFLMTNICPQNGDLNQRDWKRLEESCRQWAVRYGKVYIVAGPIFYNTNYKRIGENGIAVPDAFFKVVLAPGGETGPAKAIGFVYANAPGHKSMRHYARSVDEVEEVTGLDFFWQLEDSMEQQVESICDFRAWEEK